ncbi:molybdopterin synthase catalytic subunit-like [Saccostrea echinata]|uniref:molybdopterin synthase catalytic subunit-like n=1 Tax=Saccostrea echinata TaxID=191078 RepID=UPI002A811C98|nr:molybdopterin synthase catalytic subunit-like [Saccostrea echinata]
MDFIEITEKKLDVNNISQMVTDPSCGAISIFVGITRDNFDGKKVLRLEYEAYKPMAEKKMKEICDAVRKKWQIHKTAMIHRINVVPISEASIVIAVSSPHRKDSLQAVEYAIDTLKATVPIWKKEIYADESSSWKENKECPWSKK